VSGALVTRGITIAHTLCTSPVALGGIVGEHAGSPTTGCKWATPRPTTTAPQANNPFCPEFGGKVVTNKGGGHRHNASTHNHSAQPDRPCPPGGAPGALGAAHTTPEPACLGASPWGQPHLGASMISPPAQALGAAATQLARCCATMWPCQPMVAVLPTSYWCGGAA